MSKCLLNAFFLLITLNVCSRSLESRVRETPDASAAVTPDVPADAETVLRRLSDFYRQVETLEVESEQTIRVTTGRTEDCTNTRCAIAAARPNRLSVQSAQGTTTLHLVSDGERLVTWVPGLDQYSEAPAPESMERLLQNRLAVRSAQFVLHLLTDDPYEMLMAGVIRARYVGREQLDGGDVHHLHMLQDDVEWDVRVQAVGAPLLLQVSVDMSGVTQPGEGHSESSGKMTITETFRNWRINAPLTKQRFSCTSPEWAGNTACRLREVADQEPHLSARHAPVE